MHNIIIDTMYKFSVYKIQKILHFHDIRKQKLYRQKNIGIIEAFPKLQILGKLL
jgi:hypothetical protein